MKSLVRLGELRADQQRHDPAGDEEEPGRADVEDPDPLVVDGDEPAREAAALPGGSWCGLDVNRHRALLPRGSRSAPPSAARPSPCRPAASRPAARCGRPARAPPASSSSWLPASARADVALAGEPVALRARAAERLLAERRRCPSSWALRLLLQPGVELRCAASPRPRPSSPRAGSRRTRRTGRGRSPARSALNHVSFVTPGIASNLPPSAGIHQEWITSKSGAVTSSRTLRPTGARSLSTAITPFG